MVFLLLSFFDFILLFVFVLKTVFQYSRVILKLCSLMISRSMNVRETARKVGVQVCECLGPRYLPVIIKEMKLIMKKGFQVRVRAEWKTTSFRARCN